MADEAEVQTAETGTEAEQTAATETETAPAAAETATQQQTLAEGAETAAPAAPQNWPDNWRDLLAGEDQKALKALQRLQSPNDLFRSYAELRARMDSGTYIRRPATRSTPEEMAAWNKAMGIPDEPTGYLDKIKLSNDRVLGDDDKPLVESFAKALHPHGATPAHVSAAVDWFKDYQQAQSEAQFEADATFKVESEAALKQEMGGDYKPMVAAISQLMSNADQDVQELLLYGRTADGKLLGNHPVVLKFLGRLARELYPAASMHAIDGDAGRSIDNEISELEQFMHTNRAEYFKDEKKQARYRELLDLRDRIQARTRAA